MACPKLSTIDHADANKFTPPRTSIWRGLKKGSWHGHAPPFQRVSGTIEREGSEKGALLKVLRCLWTAWCTLNGCEFCGCPLKGLFDPDYDGRDM